MNTRKILTLVLAGASAALAGCVAVPAGPNGSYVYYPLPPLGPAGPSAGEVTAPPAARTQWPAVLQARLYPSNEMAAQTGVVSGTVTNMMNGKGRFQLQYAGETLVGEATSVDGNAKRGVASAYGSNGGFMSCEYQLNTPRQGAGNCSFSNGAQYKLHIGL
ncbi:hypothetical protein [Ramlibacter sp. 2FC]|uniref:hypothetical protein n=1 Tax=Ramlibacter sp. 2FC TaxID=2502188 RepID=UPI0010F99F71|nr:hypothetical protein [Ramlibacter sp. 2FC]